MRCTSDVGIASHRAIDTCRQARPIETFRLQRRKQNHHHRDAPARSAVGHLLLGIPPVRSAQQPDAAGTLGERRLLTLSALANRPHHSVRVVFTFHILTGSGRWKKPHKSSNQFTRCFIGIFLTRQRYSTFHYVLLTRHARQTTSRCGNRTCQQHALEQ